jgi:hypothetical protein
MNRTMSIEAALRWAYRDELPKQPARVRPPEEAGKPRTLVVFAGADLALSDRTRALLKDAQDQIERAAAAAKFKGKSGSALEILAPVGVPASRLLAIGAGAGGGHERTQLLCRRVEPRRAHSRGRREAARGAARDGGVRVRRLQRRGRRVASCPGLGGSKLVRLERDIGAES